MMVFLNELSAFVMLYAHCLTCLMTISTRLYTATAKKSCALIYSTSLNNSFTFLFIVTHLANSFDFSHENCAMWDAGKTTIDSSTKEVLLFLLY